MKTKYQPRCKKQKSEATKDHKAKENKIRHFFTLYRRGMLVQY